MSIETNFIWKLKIGTNGLEDKQVNKQHIIRFHFKYTKIDNKFSFFFLACI